MFRRLKHPFYGANGMVRSPTVTPSAFRATKEIVNTPSPLSLRPLNSVSTSLPSFLEALLSPAGKSLLQVCLLHGPAPLLPCSPDQLLRALL